MCECLKINGVCFLVNMLCLEKLDDPVCQIRLSDFGRQNICFSYFIFCEPLVMCITYYLFTHTFVAPPENSLKMYKMASIGQI
jgi:hypothetical protein